MRILYGVHGYGRGHAARSLPLLQALSARHEVLVLTGGDAAPLLSAFPSRAIPGLGYAYSAARISAARTLWENAAFVASLSHGGGPLADVERAVAEFAPDVIVSDSEPLVLHAGRRLEVPRIALDHVGMIAWCRPAAPLGDRLSLARDGLLYRLLMGRPDRVIVSSFFAAPPRRAEVTLVPPVLRERVLRAQPTDRGHLLVYFNHPRRFTPAVLAAIVGAGIPAIAYGAGRTGRVGDVAFEEIDEARFVEDLASARAVLATAGHQLAAEALHLGKPMLLSPEETAEQRLNARELVRLGVARSVAGPELTPSTLRTFLETGCERHRAPLAQVSRDGNARALAVLEEAIRALATRAAAEAARRFGRRALA